jgi:hypothetical protein
MIARIFFAAIDNDLQRLLDERLDSRPPTSNHG